MPLPELIEAEDLFKGSVWDPLLDFGLAALYVEFPYLNWWPLNAAIKHFASKLTDSIYKALTEVLNLKYVILKNLGMQEMFTAHALRMKNTALKNGIGSEEFKHAKEEAKKALAAKVRSLLIPTTDKLLARASAKCEGMRLCGRVVGRGDLRRVEYWKNVGDELRAIC